MPPRSRSKPRGHKFNRGSFIVQQHFRRPIWRRPANELGVRAWAVDAAPTVKTHPLRAARIAIMHTWLNTQAEGWWRLEFDRLKIPYTYFSTQTVSKEADLRSKYDVIIFAPGAGGNPQTIVSGRADVWQSSAVESHPANSESGANR